MSGEKRPGKIIPANIRVMQSLLTAASTEDPTIVRHIDIYPPQRISEENIALVREYWGKGCLTQIRALISEDSWAGFIRIPRLERLAEGLDPQGPIQNSLVFHYPYLSSFVRLSRRGGRKHTIHRPVHPGNFRAITDRCDRLRLDQH